MADPLGVLQKPWYQGLAANGTEDKATELQQYFDQQPAAAPAPPTSPAPAPTPQPAAAPAPTANPMAAIPNVTQTQTTVSSVRDNPEAQAKADDAQKGLETAITEGANLGAKQAAAEATYRQQGAQRSAELDAQAQNNEMVRQNRIDQALNTHQRLLGDLMDNSKVDPNRYFKRIGTGGQILGAIGVALSRLGGGDAYPIIQDAINRDIDAQKHEIELKKDKIALQGNLLAQLRAQGIDERAAESLARQRAFETTAQQLAAVSAKSPDQIKQQAAQTIAQLNLASAQEEKKRKAITVQNVTATHPAFSPADLAKMDQDKLKRFVPDVNAFAPNEQIANEAIKFNAAHKSVVGQIDKLKNLVGQYGNESLPTTAKAQMEQLRMMLLTQLKNREGLGAMSDGDRGLLEAQVADPTKWFTRGSTTVKLLDDLEGTLNDARMNTFKAYGLVR